MELEDLFLPSNIVDNQIKQSLEKNKKGKNNNPIPNTMQSVEKLNTRGIIECEEFLFPEETLVFYDSNGNVINWVTDYYLTELKENSSELDEIISERNKAKPKSKQQKWVARKVPPDIDRIRELRPNTTGRIFMASEMQPKRTGYLQYEYEYVQNNDIERLEYLVDLALKETNIGLYECNPLTGFPINPNTGENLKIGDKPFMNPRVKELPECLQVDTRKKIISIDYETNGVDPYTSEVFLISVAWGNPYHKLDYNRDLEYPERPYYNNTSKNNKLYGNKNNEIHWRNLENRNAYDLKDKYYKAFTVDCRWMDETTEIGKRAANAIRKLLTLGRLTAHNAIFEFMFGLRRFGVETNIVLDTMVGTQVAWAGYVRENASTFGGASLEDRAAFWLGIQLDKKVGRKEFPSLKKNSPLKNHQLAYNALDAIVGMEIYAIVLHRLIESGQIEIYDKIENPLIRVLAKMTLTGVWINKKAVNELESKIPAIEAEAYSKYREVLKEYGFPEDLNPLSPDALLKAFNKAGYELENTSVETLEELTIDGNEPHPVAMAILEVRNITKLKSTYVDPYTENFRNTRMNEVTRRVHADFLQNETSTGRQACRNPNLQNIPSHGDLAKVCRAIFKGPPGSKCIICDYSTMEVRGLARDSKDLVMIKLLREGSDALNKLKSKVKELGIRWPSEDDYKKLAETNPDIKELLDIVNHKDFHRQTASTLFEKDPSEITKDERSRSKCVTFGVPYGATATRISQAAEVSEEEAQKLLDTYYDKFKDVAAYLENCEKVEKPGRKEKFTLTMAGRKRHYWIWHSKELKEFIDFIPENHISWSAREDLNKRKERARREIDKSRSRVGRQARNAPIQGLNADATKRAEIILNEQVEKLNEKYRSVGYIDPNTGENLGICGIMFSVHDEIVSWIIEQEDFSAEDFAQVVYDAMLIASQVDLGYDDSDPFYVPTEVGVMIDETWTK